MEDPSELQYGARGHLKKTEPKWYAENGLAWAYPFGRETGMRRLLANLTAASKGTGIALVVADTVRPEALLMHAMPPKRWADTESFGPMASLAALYHQQDAKVTSELNVTLGKFTALFELS